MTVKKIQRGSRAGSRNSECALIKRVDSGGIGLNDLLWLLCILNELFVGLQLPPFLKESCY